MPRHETQMEIQMQELTTASVPRAAISTARSKPFCDEQRAKESYGPNQLEGSKLLEETI
ncbi:4484_t:CDS:2 [Gigaspora rosea]|nr:4484_t:CDS:2 [Gigaspora rosea]